VKEARSQRCGANQVAIAYHQRMLWIELLEVLDQR
jgi:hypothetical protein